jgi:hypothetical protein
MRDHDETIISHPVNANLAVASALLSSKIVKGSILKVYPGFPHGMCQTHKDVINADLLAFLKGEKAVAADLRG